MHRFFGKLQDHLIIEGEELRHLRDVLRLREGSEVEVTDGERVFRGCLSHLEENQAIIDSWQEVASKESFLSIHLFVALGKGEKMDWIVQKCTELGVHSITPLLTERVIVRWDPKKGSRKIQRWERIAKEAAKQCKRTRPPIIKTPISLWDVSLDSSYAVLCYEDRPMEKMDTSDLEIDDIALFIGPEGGFTRSEARFLLGKGARLMGLGPRILRMETATVAALTMLQYRYGDMGD